ncbi:DUF2513 domain-containing protein [Phytopseudomonas dryadis]|uniref:DUF2513 domain-containing protein n=1 Tax=Phytopseudomonas dryadis TaxID=2487520 RepID=A0A4Q9QRM5_9GAMM|nr:DUF2513 domain-containing protein [Pseudomonas dryadis]TBU83535.1 hypothetical protein DNK44_25730 [Pseudomonas dryadis]
MKRDWELIRELLLQIEALETGHHFFPQAVNEHSAESVGYHIHLMCQAGLIECSQHHPWNGGPVSIANGLTLTGHDLLDGIREGSLWEAKKAFLQARVGGITYEGLKGSLPAGAMLYAGDSTQDEGHNGHVYN